MPYGKFLTSQHDRDRKILECCTQPIDRCAGTGGHYRVSFGNQSYGLCLKVLCEKLSDGIRVGAALRDDTATELRRSIAFGSKE